MNRPEFVLLETEANQSPAPKGLTPSYLMPSNKVETRQQSYGEEKTTFVDRLRTALVGRSISRKLPSRSDLVALDLGCGYHAGYLKMIRHRLAEGTGVDVSVAPECDSIPHLKFIRSAIDQALPALPSNRYDLILFISVLEHLHSPLDALEHCHRLLKPGGLLMVNVPTRYAKPSPHNYVVLGRRTAVIR